MQKIEECFQQQDLLSTVVLTGMGGCGKSQLALAYCQAAEESGKYGMIFWIDATSPLSASQSFTSIADTMKCKVDTTNLAVNVHSVLSRLSKRTIKPWLLVYDNFDDPFAFPNIHEYLPRQTHRGSVIITSRNAETKGLGTAIDITTLAQDEALELLLGRSQTERTQENIAHAIQIIDRLGSHALAIDQAAAYIARGVGIDGYVSHYEERRESILNEASAFTTYRRRLDPDAQNETDLSVRTTCELSLATLSGTDKDKSDKRELLALLALLNGTEISTNLFEPHLEMHKNWMTSCRTGGNWDQERFEDHLRDLKDLSLLQTLQIGKSETKLTVHPLIRDWAKERSDPSQRQRYMETVYEVLADFLTWHCSVVGMAGLSLDVRHATFLQMDEVCRNGRRYLKSSNYHQSLPLQRSIETISTVYTMQGHLAKAEELLKHLEEGRRIALGPDNPLTISCMGTLAKVLDAQGKLDQAQTLLNQALRMSKKTLGDDNEQTLAFLCDLGRSYMQQRRFVQAEAIQRQVLKSRRKVFGHGHAMTISSINDLVPLLVIQKKEEDAEELCAQAVELGRGLGEENPVLHESMWNQAYIFTSQGKFEQARKLQEQVIKLKEAELGKENTVVVRQKLKFAEWFLYQGDYKQTEAVVREVFEMLEKAEGVEHELTLRAMGWLAELLCRLHRLEEGEVLFQKAVALQDKAFTPGHHGRMELQKRYTRIQNMQKARALGEDEAVALFPNYGTDKLRFHEGAIVKITALSGTGHSEWTGRMEDGREGCFPCWTVQRGGQSLDSQSALAANTTDLPSRGEESAPQTNTSSTVRPDGKQDQSKAREEEMVTGIRHLNLDSKTTTSQNHKINNPHRAVDGKGSHVLGKSAIQHMEIHLI